MSVMFARSMYESLRKKKRPPVSEKPNKQKNSSIKKVCAILQKPETSRTEQDHELLKNYSNIVEEATERLEKRQKLKDRTQEVEDNDVVLEEKCQMLAEAVSCSENLIVYTGAGISTAARIPDYRGTSGIWTLLQQGKDIGLHDLSQAEPTYTHMALSELYKRGKLKHLVSQNCDGLHLRSGLPKKALSEVHGNMYIEVCKTCKPSREYLRLFDVTENTARYSHKTFRRCYKCNSPLTDSIVHFGERGNLPWPLNWKGACKAVENADTIICIGSSLKVLKKYPWLWCMDKPLKRRPKLYIINLQWTPKDCHATVKINGKCDNVMRRLMKYLQVPVPEYKRLVDPIFAHATALCKEEEHTTSQPSLKVDESIKIEEVKPDLKKEVKEEIDSDDEPLFNKTTDIKLENKSNYKKEESNIDDDGVPNDKDVKGDSGCYIKSEPPDIKQDDKEENDKLDLREEVSSTQEEVLNTDSTQNSGNEETILKTDELNEQQIQSSSLRQIRKIRQKCTESESSSPDEAQTNACIVITIKSDEDLEKCCELTDSKHHMECKNFDHNEIPMTLWEDEILKYKRTSDIRVKHEHTVSSILAKPTVTIPPINAPWLFAPQCSLNFNLFDLNYLNYIHAQQIQYNNYLLNCLLLNNLSPTYMNSMEHIPYSKKRNLSHESHTTKKVKLEENNEKNIEIKKLKVNKANITNTNKCSFCTNQYGSPTCLFYVKRIALFKNIDDGVCECCGGEDEEEEEEEKEEVDDKLKEVKNDNEVKTASNPGWYGKGCKKKFKKKR